MARKFRVLPTQAAAIAAEATISAGRGYPIVGRNALTGELAPDKQQTIRWAVPFQVEVGRGGARRWVFPSPNGDSVAAGPDWLPIEQ